MAPTTRHLRVLENAGLLAHERQGRARVYRVAREPLALLGEWLAWFDRPGGVAGEVAEPPAEARAKRK